jgi:glycosyltransferase involved in cell wall biosynthesis
VNWKAQCAAIVPCANEAKTIGSLVTAVRSVLSHVIVVDDGSVDNTGSLARSAGAEVIRRDAHPGKGAALRAGLARAAERGFTWALMMDGDGQHAPEDIPALLAAAGPGNADLIVGNRMLHADRMPFVRRHVNKWMSRRLSGAAGVDLPDSQCGFRLMRLEALSAISLQTERFEIESEMLLAFIARKYSVKFVPVRVIYKDERSKIHPLRDTLRWFRWWRTI